MAIIKEIDYGIAFRIGNTIYINRATRKYPALFKSLILHELKHTKDKNKYKLKDLKNDLNPNDLRHVKKEYYKFLFTQKKAWYQLLPFLRVDGNYTIDPLITGFWFIIGGKVV
jgi:hypothetical protein